MRRIVPVLGFSGYQPFIRAYVSQGLRTDLERLGTNPAVANLVESLRRRGVQEDVIVSALAEARITYTV